MCACVNKCRPSLGNKFKNKLIHKNVQLGAALYICMTVQSKDQFNLALTIWSNFPDTEQSSSEAPGRAQQHLRQTLGSRTCCSSSLVAHAIACPPVAPTTMALSPVRREPEVSSDRLSEGAQLLFAQSSEKNTNKNQYSLL